MGVPQMVTYWDCLGLPLKVECAPAVYRTVQVCYNPVTAVTS